MQRILLVLLLNSILFAARSQTSSTRIPDDNVMSSPDTISKVFVKLGMPSEDELLQDKINFSGVRFIDNRFDSSNIAYYYTGSTFEKINFKNSFSTVLDQYVNTSFKNSFTENKDSLLVVVDFLRISPGRYDLPGNTANKFVKVKLLFAKKVFNQIFILENWDTILLYKRKIYQDEYANCIKKTLKIILLKANDLSYNKNNQEEIITESILLHKHPNNLNIQILKDSILNIGVYTNFKQVINNSPKYPGYELKYKNYYFINVVDEKGAKVDWRDIWGYCDGKTIYVYSESNESFFPLIREGNSWTISLKSPNVESAKKSSQVANGFLLVFSALTHSSSSGAVGYDIVPPVITEKLGRKNTK